MGGSTCTCIEIQCVDRKCLVLDILWAVHSLGVRLVQSRINHPGSDDAGCQKGKICVQLFLRDRTSGAFMEEARLRFVLEQLHRAITLPVSVTVRPPRYRCPCLKYSAGSCTSIRTLDVCACAWHPS